MATRQGILGRKLGMTRRFAEDGTVVSVTVIEAGPCFVTQVKSAENDGYAAIQMGFGESKRLNSPERGHLKGLPTLRHLQELRTDDADRYERGQRLDVGMFKPGDVVVTRNLHPVGHTRLPRYARGRRGVVDRDHGVFIFPDAHAAGLGKRGEHCYSVRFEARELWGEEASPRDAVYIDLFEPYLRPAAEAR